MRSATTSSPKCGGPTCGAVEPEGKGDQAGRERVEASVFAATLQGRCSSFLPTSQSALGAAKGMEEEELTQPQDGVSEMEL